MSYHRREERAPRLGDRVPSEGVVGVDGPPIRCSLADWHFRAHLGITGALGALTILGSLILSGTTGLVGGFGALVVVGAGGIASMVVHAHTEEGSSDGPFAPLFSGWLTVSEIRQVQEAVPG